MQEILITQLMQKAQYTQKDFSELVLYPSGRTGEYTTHPNTKKIRNRAFYYAQKLTKITFNSGLEEIGNDVFQGAASLKEIEYEPNGYT